MALWLDQTKEVLRASARLLPLLDTCEKTKSIKSAIALLQQISKTLMEGLVGVIKDSPRLLTCPVLKPYLSDPFCHLKASAPGALKRPSAARLSICSTMFDGELPCASAITAAAGRMSLVEVGPSLNQQQQQLRMLENGAGLQQYSGLSPNPRQSSAGSHPRVSVGGEAMLMTGLGGGMMTAWATKGGGRGEGERGMPENSQLTLAVVGDVKLAKLRRTMDQQVRREQC